jgi:hypothetical protein
MGSGQSQPKLYKIGESLEVVADQHSPAEEVSTVICGNAHNAVNMLKAAVLMKMSFSPNSMR